MLEVLEVSKSYEQDGPGQGVQVLKKVSLKLSTGQSMSIVGPSGSGKSTLLNIMGALDRPTSGKVLLDGRDLETLSDDQLAGVRNKDIGFVFQMHHLLPQCTVIENVLIPTLARDKSSESGSVGRAEDLLGRVGLLELATRRPGELSGGQRQRVAVARALINEPRFLLADEPTGSLDKESSENVADLLKELNCGGLAMLVVTHSISLAEKIGEVFDLRDGRLKKRGGQ